MVTIVVQKWPQKPTSRTVISRIAMVELTLKYSVMNRPSPWASRS